MSDPTIARVDGIGKQVVDALKVSPALLALMLFMGVMLYLIADAASEQRALVRFMVERCVLRTPA